MIYPGAEVGSFACQKQAGTEEVFGPLLPLDGPHRDDTLKHLVRISLVVPAHDHAAYVQ